MPGRLARAALNAAAAVLCAVVLASVAAAHHGEDPPPVPYDPPVYLDFEKVYPCRWSWVHWWEANRDPYLRRIVQGQGGQAPNQEAVKKYRDLAVKALMTALGEPQWQVRSAAAIALGRMGEESASRRLMTMARFDEEERARMSALVALGLLDAAPTRDFLVNHVYATERQFEAGCGGLGLLRESDAPAVMTLLQQTAAGERVGAASVSAWGLRRKKDPAGGRFLMAVLLNRKSPWLASEAILSLGRQQDPNSLKLLTDILLETDGVKLVSSWRALKRRDIEIGRLAGNKVDVKPDEAEKYKEEYTKYSDWRRYGPNQPANPTNKPEVTIRTGIEAIYIARLRVSAAIALGEIGDPRAEAVLLKALALQDDPYTEMIKGFAIMSLGQIGSENVLPALLAILSPTRPGGGRKSALQFDSPMRGYAALALGLYARVRQTPQGDADAPGYDRVCEVLAERMGDVKETLEVRAAAAMGLGLTGRTENLRHLIRERTKANLDQESLIGYTMLASAMLGDRNILEPARRFLDVAKEKTDTSGILGRRAAVLGLGLLKTPETIPVLIDAWHLNYYVNREVAVAFNLAEAYNVTEALVKLIEDLPDAREFSINCLGLLFVEERPERLAWFLNGSNYTMRNVRMMPYQALANEFLYRYLIASFGDDWQ